MEITAIILNCDHKICATGSRLRGCFVLCYLGYMCPHLPEEEPEDSEYPIRNVKYLDAWRDFQREMDHGSDFKNGAASV